MTLKTKKIALSLAILWMAGCSSGFGGEYWVGTNFQCVTYVPPDYEEMEVEVDEFTNLKLTEQEGPELCWAAAIQAVLAYNGKSVSQAEIVEKVRGPYSEKGYSAATLREIIAGVSGRQTSWYVNNGNSTQLINDLKMGNPVILGLSGEGTSTGHIVVAYGASYVLQYPSGKWAVEFVDVWDPWVGEGHQTLDGCEVYRDIDFALHAWNP